MKAIYCENGQSPRIVPLYRGVVLHDEDLYGVREVDDFKLPPAAMPTFNLPHPENGEYFGVSLAMAMYEGGETSGVYLNWSWSLLPETADDVAHLENL